MTSGPAADVAVIGGSGLYELGQSTEQVQVDTPWGAPSSPITLAEVNGRTVAFLARHGIGHRLPPHAVENRANLWALRELGVRAVLASFACGSLDPLLGPGALVVPDQLIDQTRGRSDTIHETFAEGPAHAAFADPYDAATRAAALRGCERAGQPARDGGTVVVINGPRFATRAESRWYRSIGADLINMTQYPETVIARELDLPYAAIGLVTDHDVGLEGEVAGSLTGPVHQELVFEVFAQHLPVLRSALLAAVGELP